MKLTNLTKLYCRGVRTLLRQAEAFYFENIYSLDPYNN